MTTLTKKAQIFDNLQKRFGSNTFRYTDITIAALMVNGWIQDPSEYDWREHRGYYARVITGYSGHMRGFFYKASDYMFKPSKGDTRRLDVIGGGSSKRYLITT